MSLFDWNKDKDKDKTKAKPDFSSVRTGGSSTAPAPAPSPVPQADGAAAATSGSTYVVVDGDSLSKIAKHHYGDASKWRRIYEANRTIISNPDLIHPGQRLHIPN